MAEPVEITITSGGGSDQFSAITSIKGWYRVRVTPSTSPVFDGTIVVQDRLPNDTAGADWVISMKKTAAELDVNASFADFESGQMVYRVGALAAPSTGSCKVQIFQNANYNE